MSKPYMLTAKGISKNGERLGWQVVFKNMDGSEVDRFFLPTSKDLYKFKFQLVKLAEHVIEMCNGLKYIPADDIPRWELFCETIGEGFAAPC
jgi:hypothetical protein